jgi:dTDP-glucose pyrophosphorylase
MSYWIKLFSDGTQEKGTDTNIARGGASWSRGRLASMIGVILKFGGHRVVLLGQGPYWQKDVGVASEHRNQRVARQIGRKIHQDDVGWAILHAKELGVFTILIAKEKPTRSAVQIKQSHVGSYLVATITNLGGIDLTVETNFYP